MRLIIRSSGPLGKDAQIMLNEEDISLYVRSVELKMDVDTLHTATIEFYAYDGFDIDVHLDDDKGLKGKRIDIEKGKRAKSKRSA